jgi:hypothetical protein
MFYAAEDGFYRFRGPLLGAVCLNEKQNKLIEIKFAQIVPDSLQAAR